MYRLLQALSLSAAADNNIPALVITFRKKCNGDVPLVVVACLVSVKVIGI